MDLIEVSQNENRHPWELSRARCILNIVKKYKLDSAADIGAGDMFFTSKLQTFVSGEIYAVDSGYGEKPEPASGIRCLNDISALPEFTGRCGLILMDVLEHIENDSAFLKKVLDKIPADSLVFITVPAFQFLFSDHDVFLRHYRRYNRKRLLSLTNSLNLRTEECRYFYASLFFARLAGLLLGKIWRGKKKQAGGIGSWHLGAKHPVTRVICAVLNADFFICGLLAKLRVTLPGLSLLAICRKQKSNNNNKNIMEGTPPLRGEPYPTL
jgi:hypothetical protein